MNNIGNTIGGFNYFLRTTVYLGVLGVVIFAIVETRSILSGDKIALEESPMCSESPLTKCMLGQL